MGDSLHVSKRIGITRAIGAVTHLITRFSISGTKNGRLNARVSGEMLCLQKTLAAVVLFKSGTGGQDCMAEGEGLEPSSPKAPVFKTGGLPVILTLR